ncbi:MAG: hypothetical protein A2365_03755 [Candidatus Nealsonbacteria bacterium RIFOXYB1_FULL_40_15]|uniref:Cell division protein FtsL n=2 Tax=Candidatus Nealsoniibacteriota TaxID=1817911 RepID=A0A1G2EM31_9BACT|nr:MAG: hypothetical protein A2427_00895 [Candidatus Nealsonbacteria bacterium RIFOXYC1_FULL_40_7]OGZ27730.1 MAG: hypothetical protein A2365_03755 [Candidatus Nealsonbacteria bacterium RIFOXYB1_FULL_40_15]OGZ29540.1 MAG: hypothetical protein A2562_02525 [Candidatus Nealsonbacteria bacterium RIFOXYD1_FULL_39_11]
MKKMPKNPFLSKGFWVFSVIIFFALAFLYILQINEETSARFSAEDCSKKISKLSKENKELELASGQAYSLDKAIEQAGRMGFQKVKQVEYIRVMDSRVVINYVSDEELEN